MVEVAEGAEEVRVAPVLAAEAVRRRLDAVAGVMGWSLGYQPLPGEAMLCRLSLGGVEKTAVVAAARAGGAVATSEAALSAAAALFGMRPPFAAGASAWLPCDPVTLEPLHLPDAEDLPATAQLPAEDRSGPEVAAILPPVAAAVDTPAAKPEGQQMIDRLVERLKEQGQGLAAARLLVRHGGYGQDAEAARSLYAALRALLVKGSASRQADDATAGAPDEREAAEVAS